MCELLKTRRSVRKYRPEQVPDELLDAVLDIDPARVYVKYAETPNWGWNGGNF